MGSKQRVLGPLCNRSIEDLVPRDHFYLHLEAKLALDFVRDLVRATHKECGHEPSTSTAASRSARYSPNQVRADRA
jgi:hypothetical protein